MSEKICLLTGKPCPENCNNYGISKAHYPYAAWFYKQRLSRDKIVAQQKKWIEAFGAQDRLKQCKRYPGVIAKPEPLT